MGLIVLRGEWAPAAPCGDCAPDGRGFRHGQRPDARQDHRRIFKQLPPTYRITRA
ncbi:MAG: hypothetical protein ACLSHC_02335 [Bilophila wadsworthia]